MSQKTTAEWVELAHESMKAAADYLRLAHANANNLEGYALLPLVKQAGEMRREIEIVLTALMLDASQVGSND